MKITIETDQPIFNRRPPMPGETITLFGHEYGVCECGWGESSSSGAIQSLKLVVYPLDYDVFDNFCTALPEVHK